MSLALTSLREERVERVILDGCTFGLLAVRLDAMLKTEELPAGVTSLDSRLSKVNKNDLTHYFL